MARIPHYQMPSNVPPIAQLLHPDNARVLVAAHRGAWNWAPENSLPSIDEAIAHGADIVECDVRATSDHVLVLMHDETVDRTTTGTGALQALSWTQVRKARLKAGSGGPDATVTGMRVPTLSEALECARNRIAINIDTKVGVLAERVAQSVISAGMADQVFVKAAIERPEEVQAIRSSPFFGRVPFVPMMKTRRGQLASELQHLEALRCPMFEVEFADLADLESARDALARLQARLWVNTIEASHSPGFNDRRALADPDAVWGRLVDAGVGAIQTDAVATLVAYLAARGVR
ncbi:MAG TPA: glycerophosphodiester phosphodiesterase family protein [Albitalea sp.]|uniref:glycerophosphodiester phosphodiesterase family protein n=1 Tax=Piscinibacter sp. TaxID=1903157 RepID=UPI002ED4299A